MTVSNKDKQKSSVLVLHNAVKKIKDISTDTDFPYSTVARWW
jgi:hypothetical protein